LRSTFFLHVPQPSELYTLSLHDALPISARASTSSKMCEPPCRSSPSTTWRCAHFGQLSTTFTGKKLGTAHRQTRNAVSRTAAALDRKSTRLNSSHVKISYAVFCLKKKKK